MLVVVGCGDEWPSHTVDLPVVLVLCGGTENGNDPVLTEHFLLELGLSIRAEVLGFLHSPPLDFAPNDHSEGGRLGASERHRKRKVFRM